MRSSLEGDARVAACIRRGLEAEGYGVTAVATGLDAVGYGMSGGYEPFILDVMVPGIGGIEACGRLRAAGISTPIVMLTARDASADVVEGLGG